MPTSKPIEATSYIENHKVYLAQPSDLPVRAGFEGREDKLRLCRVAWGLDENYRFRDTEPSNHLAFRLYGSPGMGKNELVYELVRRIRKNNPTFENIPFYSMVGHDEMSPEDMVLAVVPTESEEVGTVQMVLRASPLATAIHKGGIFFYDELNRLPERAQAPLASVLDGRGTIFSASSGVWVKPEANALPFRFCCALNPSVGTDLPGYIDQRTLPRIPIDYPGHDGLVDYIRAHFAVEAGEDVAVKEKKRSTNTSNDMEKQLQVFRGRLENSDRKPSVRQGIMLIRLARALGQASSSPADFANHLDEAFKHVFQE